MARSWRGSGSWSEAALRDCEHRPGVARPLRRGVTESAFPGNNPFTFEDILSRPGITHDKAQFDRVGTRPRGARQPGIRWLRQPLEPRPPRPAGLGDVRQLVQLVGFVHRLL